MDPLQAPAIRTALADQNGGGDLKTAKEWYYYWQRIGVVLNDDTDMLNHLVTFGTHAGRLATGAAYVASVAPGSLYIETDRGNIVYQMQQPGGANAWVYSAGVMTAPFASQPADLGANDTGFRFDTSDAPLTTYVWSGSSWINRTLLAGDIQQATASGSLTLTSTPTQIPGAVLTLARAGLYAITGHFCFVMVGAGDQNTGLRGKLYCNGADQGGLVLATAFNSNTYINVSQTWIYTAGAAGQTAYLAGYKDSGGTGSSIVQPTATTIVAQWIHA